MTDLHLDEAKRTGQEQPTIPDEELDILAQRCMIDVQQLSEQERSELRVEVGKIMKCISLVCDANIAIESSSSSSSSSVSSSFLTEEEMYDSPRGFRERSCPVRNEISELNAWTKDDGVRDDARYVLQQLEKNGKTLRVKTSESAAEETFFSIITKSGNEEDHASS